MRFCLLASLLTLPVLVAMEPLKLDIPTDLTGWSVVPNVAGAATVEQREGVEGNVAIVRGMGKNAGLQSRPLVLGKDLPADEQLEITLDVMTIQAPPSGSGAVTICCQDASGKRLSQWVICGVGGAQDKWFKRHMLINPAQYPKGTDNLILRASFYSPSGGEGAVAIANPVFSSPNQPKDEKFPWARSVVINCGDIQTRFEKGSFWTIYRYDYKGLRLSRDSFGSHYGTTTRFKGMEGFSGSGHTENEDEFVRNIELTIDGQKQVNPGQGKTEVILTAQKEMKFLRQTTIHDVLDLDTTTTLKDNVLDERVVIRARKDADMSLIYNFMHPWAIDMDKFIAVTTNGQEIEGTFDGKGMEVQKPCRWISVYSTKWNTGIVSIIMETPENIPSSCMFWDREQVYHKFYMTTFAGITIPAGQDFPYHLRTVPFEATPDNWTQVARDTAAKFSGK